MCKSRVILAMPPMDGGSSRRLLDTLGKFAIELELRKWKVVEIGQRRKSRSEIVERNADAEAPQVLKNGMYGGRVLDENGFGDLEIEPACRQPGSLQCVNDHLDEISAAAKLNRR